MAKPLNFNTFKKQYLPVTLPDDKNTCLMVGTPTKAILGALMTLQSGLESLDDSDNFTDDVINDFYDATAQILSRNKAGIKITSDYLSKILDFEDIVVLFQTYIDFVSEVTNSKN